MVIRQLIQIRGIVQGVGFRPFVFGLAEKHGLTGSVHNDGGGVQIEVQGPAAPVAAFVRDVRFQPPPVARIDHFSVHPLSPRAETGFSILPSAADSQDSAVLSPDVATCQACLDELFDPGCRRFGFAFNNCSHCGPRFTIMAAVPYDRERTAMASFEMCPACRAEYETPADRRFHAQAIACPKCGPRLELLDAAGRKLEVGNPVAHAGRRIRAGEIGALKGLGGFHLFCDAANGAAVRELRRRKQRDERAFAVMAADLGQVLRLGVAGPAERELLLSPQRPIVLLRRQTGSPVADEVAPGTPYLGVMLPYTPLHHLLLEKSGGSPLVMTSGNRSDEPIVFGDEEALPRLSGLADFFVAHNRRIHSRCDDSVVRVAQDRPVILRRARGYAPAPIRLPFSCSRAILAVGGQLKAAFAFGRGHEAVPSHHLGDLDTYPACSEFERAIAHYERLFRFTPEWLVHDLHPDYASTRYALERAQRGALRCLAVQHHHAHMASCMAENQLPGPVIGVCLDGTGYGSDGAIWGGEFLVGGYRTFERGAHFRYVPMPGGEMAIREPWRMAAAFLLAAGLRPEEFLPGIPPAKFRLVEQMAGRGVQAPLTSSCGRLFDAVASLLGIRHQASYEGQPALELEALALDAENSGCYDFALEGERPVIVDTRPIFRGIASDLGHSAPAARLARKFHSTLVQIIRSVCARLGDRSEIETVVLSGGVFTNAILLGEALDALRNDGLRVFFHAQVPSNDGGLCLGQLAVGAHQ